MEFPLKSDFFPPVRVTADDRQRYAATAEYSVHVLRKLVADDKWKRISEAKGVTVGKVHCIEEQAYGSGGGTAARACLIMCATVFATGSVSEVLEAIASPVTDDYRRAMSFLYEDKFLDGMCLHTISPKGSRNTQAFTTLKWAAFKDGVPLQSHTNNKPSHHVVGTDYCFLEHSGIQKEATKDDSFGFCIQESITRESEVPAMPGFGLGRGELHRTGLLILPTDRRDVVQISSIFQMDTSSPSLTKSSLEKIMVRRVTSVARIPILLDRRRLSKMQFLPRDQWVRDHERRTCAVCTKAFSLRRKHHCRNCGEVVCATCAPPRDVDVATYGMASIRICTACVVQARQSVSLKQEEVLVVHVTEGSVHDDVLSIKSRASSANGGRAPPPYTSMEEPVPLPRKRSSSGDSNFSISSDEGAEESGYNEEDPDNNAYDYDYEGYSFGGFERQESSNVGSIAPSTPSSALHDGGDNDDDGTGPPLRYSEFSDARSSNLSFSDYNTLSEDALRITGVVTGKPQQPQSQPQSQQQLVQQQQLQSQQFQHRQLQYQQPQQFPSQQLQYQHQQPQYQQFQSQPSQQPLYSQSHQAPPQFEQPEVKHVLYYASPPPPPQAEDNENNAPNAPLQQVRRGSMDEWFAPRTRGVQQAAHQAASSPMAEKAPASPEPELLPNERQYRDEWLAARARGHANSQASHSSGTSSSVSVQHQAPIAQRDSMEEWRTPRQPSHASTGGSSSSKAASRAGSHTGSHHSSTSLQQHQQQQQQPTQQRESMDEWLGPKRRERNHSYVSSTSSGGAGAGSGAGSIAGYPYGPNSTTTGNGNGSGRESKRSSSSADSSSSLMEMLASIHEMKNSLSPSPGPSSSSSSSHNNQQYQSNMNMNGGGQEPPFYMERLSELQLREQPESSRPDQNQNQNYQQQYKQLPVAPTPAPAPLSIFGGGWDATKPRRHPPHPANRPTEQHASLSRGGGSSADIDTMLLSDSFSLLCPDSLHRGPQAQDAGERRSARVSNLSATTVLDDDPLAASGGPAVSSTMRQSELLSLRMQVEGLHKSLEDATNKLNYFTARSMVREQVDSLEREVLELRSSERRARKLSDAAGAGLGYADNGAGGANVAAVDPLLKERKQQYHALIGELHEIMGLPALATRPRSDELIHN